MKKIKNVLIPILAITLSASFPAAFLYLQNADEAVFREILPALLAFNGVGYALMVVFGILTRSISKGAIAASIFTLVLTNFTFLENALKLLFPELKYWHTVTIVIVLTLHIIYFACHYLNRELANEVNGIICLVFGALIAINLVTGIPQIAGRIKAQRSADKVISDVQNDQEESDKQPNIYYIIFDEYAGFRQMEENYGYANQELKDFLIDNHFAISYTSHNESIISSTIQTNLVNLDYVVDDETPESEKTVLRQNGLLFDLMREHGYEIQVLETGGFYGGHLPNGNANSTGARTLGGDSMSDILEKRTILYPLLEKGYDDRLNDILSIVDYFCMEENYSRDKMFTLAYFNFPHAPFIVDENGNAIPNSEFINWDYYLGQFKYATKIMIKMVEQIISRDSDSIIMLQSDHSVRFIDTTHELMTNPLNTLYYCGEEVPIEGLSGINTIRTVLNRLWNMNFEMVELPQ